MKVKKIVRAVILLICYGFLYWKFDNKIVTSGILLVGSIYTAYSFFTHK